MSVRRAGRKGPKRAGLRVLVVTGSAARHGQRADGQSSDALVVGILD